MLNVVNNFKKDTSTSVSDMRTGDVGITDEGSIFLKAYSVTSGDHLIMLNHSVDRHNPLMVNHKAWENFKITLVKATLVIENKE